MINTQTSPLKLNIRCLLAKKDFTAANIIKFSLLLYIVLFWLTACSTISHVDSNENTNNTGILGQANFLTDILSMLQGEIEGKGETEIENAPDPVIKSTQLVLQSTPEISQANDIQEQLNEYQNKASREVHFGDVWKRLPTLYQLGDIQNEHINSQEKWFLQHKKMIHRVSTRASPFLYFITQEVAKRKMPGEIALLPFIESGFKTNAYSRMRAAGLWQFIPSTGRDFGLKQNWWYDGRRDVYKSTLAALTYLEQLNKYYKGDWLLTLAAYNAGAGTVNRAIKNNIKKGKAIDYWSLSLPDETLRYIPKLLAISHVIKKQHEYGIRLAAIENKPYLTLINIRSQIDLSVAAKMAGISKAKIRSFNPAFKQWATDPDGPHHLLIPIDKADGFKNRLATLDNKDRVKWYRHKIRSGESLGVIASKYNISVALLKRTNHLKSTRIRAGKFLMVPLDNRTKALSGVNTFAYNKPELAQKRKRSVTHKVRKGDSFWKIAHSYQVSQKQLAALNHLSLRSRLSIGQILKIPQKTTGNTSKTREISYRVKSGDSLYAISKQFNVTVNQLQRWNKLNKKKYLKPGQQLKVIIYKQQSSS